MDQRTKVVNELIATEDAYMTAFYTLQAGYMSGLCTLLTEDEYTCIFGHLEPIMTLHESFLNELEERHTTWSDTAVIGDLLLKTTPFFKMYIHYTNAHGLAVGAWQKALRREPVSQFAARAASRLGGTTLEDYLIRPIQRIPRYRLLLQELVKATPEQHDDTPLLIEALRLVSDIGTRLNEELRLMENRNQILEIQTQFIGQVTLVAPGRVFKREGDLIKVCRRENKQFHFWLFNNLLVYGRKIATNSYILNRQIPIDAAFMVVDMPSQKHYFQIRNSSKSFAVITSSVAEKEAWVKALSECILALHSSNVARKEEQAAPVWLQNNTSNACLICATPFTFFNRRHHCRKCGDLVCASCSKSRLVLQPGDKERSRVCDTCIQRRPRDAPRPPLPDRAAVTSTSLRVSQTRQRNSSIPPPPPPIDELVDSDSESDSVVEGDLEEETVQVRFSAVYSHESNVRDVHILDAGEPEETVTAVRRSIRKTMLVANTDATPNDTFTLAYDNGDTMAILMRKQTALYAENMRTGLIGWIDPTHVS